MVLFEKEVAVNASLYVINKMGGSADIHKLYKTLYFADQEHLVKYGRLITCDDYIAMNFGPVPSRIYDMFKAVRGDSYFSEEAGALKQEFIFHNQFTVRALRTADMDYLSESDIECLDNAIALCQDKSFSELTNMSHGLAWNNTRRDQRISIKDIVCEAGESEEYADYIDAMTRTALSFEL